MNTSLRDLAVCCGKRALCCSWAAALILRCRVRGGSLSWITANRHSQAYRRLRAWPTSRRRHLRRSARLDARQLGGLTSPAGLTKRSKSTNSSKSHAVGSVRPPRSSLLAGCRHIVGQSGHWVKGRPSSGRPRIAVMGPKSEAKAARN
jgi:hypothetical protein